MKKMFAWLVVTGTLMVSLAAAQGPTLGGPEEPLPDFRGKVMLAYGLVFALLITYMVISHRRNAALGEDVRLLGRRLEELEK